EEALLPEPQHFFGVPEPRSLGRDHIWNRLSDWQDVDDARMQRIVDVTLEHGIVNTPTLVSGENLLRFNDYKGPLPDSALQLMPRLFREVFWSPTDGLPVYRSLTPTQLARLRAANVKKRELAARLRKAGAKLLIGTDLQPFTVPGASLHQEMQIFVDLG